MTLWQMGQPEKAVARRYSTDMSPSSLCRFVAPDSYHDAISITLFDEEGDELEIQLGDICTIIQCHQFEDDVREPMYDVLYRGQILLVDECFLQTIQPA
jgi:hypothetical protein